MTCLKSAKSFHSLCNADDTTLSSILKVFEPGTQTQHTDEVINSELEKISDWLIVNKLSLNIPKIKFFIFKKRKMYYFPRN